MLRVNEIKTVEVIGVPMDMGANTRGACMGPMAIRIRGLKSELMSLGYDVLDRGDIAVPPREAILGNDKEHMFLGPIVETCGKLMSMLKDALKRGHLPLILGGDHSIAIGSISGSAEHLRDQDQKLGLIWIDAHADFNDPSSSVTGNIHGMPLATILGRGFSSLVALSGMSKRLDPQNISLIGIRLLDDEEQGLLRSSGITYFTMRDIDKRGMEWVMEQSIAIASKGTSGIHLSFDLDSLDPCCAPGVSTPVPGGLTAREALLACEIIHEQALILSMDFVELNPMFDVQQRTAGLCIDLIQRVLGKKII